MKYEIRELREPFARRICYFILPIGYDTRLKSFEKIYEDCLEATFVKERAEDIILDMQKGGKYE